MHGVTAVCVYMRVCEIAWYVMYYNAECGMKKRQ